jgi:hypothetical protein
MTSAIHPTLFNVRTIGDIKTIEDDALERYNVPDNWLNLELLGLSAIFETFSVNDEPEKPGTQVLPKRPFLLDNIVNRSVPLYLRL